MKKNQSNLQQIIDAINFFKNLKITLEDTTTDEEKKNHQKSVRAHYFYEGKEYITTKLFYQDIQYAPSVEDPEKVINFFEEKVYWLDISE
ncbi:MAG: hypothetical protein GXO27_02330, partial [Chlorobi bacterium]|nr:hypothetical protein [Chlorobiota bacterium]